jgi:hypothetical protein
MVAVMNASDCAKLQGRAAQHRPQLASTLLAYLPAESLDSPMPVAPLILWLLLTQHPGIRPCTLRWVTSRSL